LSLLAFLEFSNEHDKELGERFFGQVLIETPQAQPSLASTLVSVKALLEKLLRPTDQSAPGTTCITSPSNQNFLRPASLANGRVPSALSDRK
jgi:hypothetical protein